MSLYDRYPEVRLLLAPLSPHPLPEHWMDQVLISDVTGEHLDVLCAELPESLTRASQGIEPSLWEGKLLADTYPGMRVELTARKERLEVSAAYLDLTTLPQGTDLKRLIGESRADEARVVRLEQGIMLYLWWNPQP